MKTTDVIIEMMEFCDSCGMCELCDTYCGSAQEHRDEHTAGIIVKLEGK